MKKNLILIAMLFFCVEQSYSAVSSRPATPVIYTADLFHPYADPDDHWDIATIYALAEQNIIDLRGICLNWPYEAIWQKYMNASLGDPAIMSVAQMDFITGRTTLCGIGSGKELKSADDPQSDCSSNGINLIIDTLKRSERKVVIYIVGSTRDVAIAANREPDLFAQKCAAIYLVAGSSDGKGDEWNVILDRKAFISIFQIPCPVYWMPCIAAGDKDNKPVRGEYDCWYKFNQHEILPALSSKMQNFFTFALNARSDVPGSAANYQWLRSITAEPNKQDVAKYGEQERGMWSTPAFLHCAEKTVTREGEIVDIGKDVNDAVFTFKPVKINIKPDGAIGWSFTNEPTRHYIIHKDEKHYDSAMTKALKKLLVSLP